MTVKELTNTFLYLDRIVIVYDNGKIETINCEASGSWVAIRKHYDRTVERAIALDENEIVIVC